MNIKKQLILITCIVLINSYSTIKPMDSRINSPLKNKVIIASIAVCLLGASYGFYKTLNYFFPPKNNRRVSKTQAQSIGHVKAQGNAIITQEWADGDHQDVGDVSGAGDIIISQTGTGAQSMGNVTRNKHVSIAKNHNTHNPTTDCSFKTISETDTTKTVICDLNAQHVYAIHANGIGELHISQAKDNKEYVSLTTDKNIINNLRIQVDNKGSLFIGPKQDTVIKFTQHIIYAVALKDITHLHLGGRINANFVTNIKENELHCTLKGQTRLNCKENCTINTDLLSATCSDASGITLKGQAKHQRIYLSDSANYWAQDLISHYTYIEAKGINNTLCVNAKKTLAGVTSMLTTLQYKGQPDLSDLQRHPLATIRNID